VTRGGKGAKWPVRRKIPKGKNNSRKYFPQRSTFAPERQYVAKPEDFATTLLSKHFSRS